MSDTHSKLLLADWLTEQGFLRLHRDARGELTMPSTDLFTVALEAARRSVSVSGPIEELAKVDNIGSAWARNPRLHPGHVYDCLKAARGRAIVRKLEPIDIEKTLELHVEALFLAARHGIETRKVMTRVVAGHQLIPYLHDDRLHWEEFVRKGAHDIIKCDGLWAAVFRNNYWGCSMQEISLGLNVFENMKWEPGRASLVDEFTAPDSILKDWALRSSFRRVRHEKNLFQGSSFQ